MSLDDSLPVAVFAHRGQEIRLHGYARHDHIFAAIAGGRRFYELDLLEYMRLVIGHGDFSIIDVGANIGNHAVYCGRFVAALVIAVEPNPPVADILERNLRDNAIAHRLFRTGLGASAGSAVVELPSGHGGNVGAARLVRSADGAGVPLTTLDALAAGLVAEFDRHPPRAVKIDVEGMETEVLEGARGVLGRWRPDLFVEAIDDACRQRLDALLLPLGYRRLISRATTPVWHYAHRDRVTLRLLSRIIALVLRERAAKLWRRLAARWRRPQPATDRPAP